MICFFLEISFHWGSAHLGLIGIRMNSTVFGMLLYYLYYSVCCRWVCCSGLEEDLMKTDNAAIQVFSELIKGLYELIYIVNVQTYLTDFK